MDASDLKPEHGGIAAFFGALGVFLARYLPKRRALPAGETSRVRELEQRLAEKEEQLEAAKELLSDQKLELLKQDLVTRIDNVLRENGRQQQQLDQAKRDVDALGAKCRILEHRLGKTGGNMSHTFAELLASKTLRGLPLDAPLQLLPDSGPTELIAVQRQFKVESSARYARDQHTYCNIYLWDFTRAAGCEVPHWAFNDGTPATAYQTRTDSKGVTELAYEMNANDTTEWLEKYGPLHGWRRLDYDAETHTTAADQARELANNGGVAIFAWRNPTGGPGHVGAVRPSADGELHFAQAGGENSSDIKADDVFISNTPTFYARSRA
jgi:hypothetical protein